MSTDYYSVDWLEHNVLESLAPSQLDGAAAFYGSLALADSLGNGGNGFLLGNEREDYGRQILKHSLAVNKLTLFRKSVQAPPARRPELQHNPRKWQKEMHAIHGNGATGAEGAPAAAPRQFRLPMSRSVQRVQRRARRGDASRAPPHLPVKARQAASTPGLE